MPSLNGDAVPRRILIVLMGSIGDVVRGLPLLGRIRNALPSAHIAWAVEPKSAPVLEGHPWLNEVLLYDRRRPLSFLAFLSAVRRGNFDLVLDLQRHLKSGIVSWISGAKLRWGFSRPNTKEFNYLFSNRTIPDQPNMRLKLLQYQAFGDALKLPNRQVEFGLEPREDARNRMNQILASAPRPLLGVILGSSWESRVYFPESVASVIRTLAIRDGHEPLFPVLLGGVEDQLLATQVQNAAPEVQMLNLAGKTQLKDLAAIFKQCVVAFGPDSGPMHIAAAVGCPTVSLWGATAPERSAPWGFADLAMAAEIPCHPCYLRDCPIGRECMRRIDPDAVVAMIRKATLATALHFPASSHA